MVLDYHILIVLLEPNVFLTLEFIIITDLSSESSFKMTSGVARGGPLGNCPMTQKLLPKDFLKCYQLPNAEKS
jgi:hypothetical protein